MAAATALVLWRSAARLLVFFVTAVVGPVVARGEDAGLAYNVSLHVGGISGFGAEVVGLDVPKLLSLGEGSRQQEVTDDIRRILHKNRFVLFRGIDVDAFSWRMQIAFGELFGDLFDESSHVNRKTRFHGERDPRVAHFSNHPAHGLVGVGIEGYHVDGNVAAVPHEATIIFCESSIEGGDTMLVPLNEVATRIRQESGELVRGVSFVSAHNKSVVHPLIYPHPATGLDTMVFGLGSLSGRYLRHGVEMSEAATQEVMDAVESSIEATGPHKHAWRAGDLLMLDNLGLAHRASDGTQNQDVDDVGVRIVRRITIAGTNEPSVRPRLLSLPHRCDLSNETCLVSLADHVGYVAHSGVFHSREAARSLCKYTIGASADLASLPTPELAALAAELVTETGRPHWLAAVEAAGSDIEWLSLQRRSGAVDTWPLSADGRKEYPWDSASGQPNDCDGPGSEPCVFVGPAGKWFDFACEPKTAQGTTPGPEITWTDGSRRMHNVHPLCQVDRAELFAQEEGGALPAPREDL